MIETPRLRLRPWTEADKPAFRRLVNTPTMMRHFGGVAPDEKIDALLDAQMANEARDGHCMWAVEMRDDAALAGICGLRIGGHSGTPVPDELEVGWRIGERWWGRGVAREAAEASIRWGWAQTVRTRIAAWTSIGNARSWGLMERLGMERRPDLDFDHPLVPRNDPDGRMIVYVIDRP